MKKLLAALLLGLVLGVAALPVSALGAQGDVTLTARKDGADVALALPEDEAEGITALSLGFTLEGGPVEGASFDFAAGLDSTVQEYRYDAQTGRLNIYIAGGQEVLPGGTAELGRITVQAPQGAQVEIGVAEDSLQLVNSAFGKTAGAAAQGAPVSITVGQGSGSGSTPEPTAPPSQGGGSQGGGSQDAPTSQAAQPAPTPEPDVTPTPTPTVAPAAPPAGGQGAAGTSGGNGTGSGRATPAPSASPTPSASPAPDQPEQTPTPQPEQTPAPEQPQQDAEKAVNPLLIVAVVLAVLAAVVLIAMLVVRLRHR